MKHFINFLKALVGSFLFCFSLLQVVFLYDDNWGYGAYFLMAVLALLFFVLLSGFFIYLSLKGKFIKIFIGYLVMMGLLLAFPFFIAVKKMVGRDAPPENAHLYYYFPELDTNRLYDDPKYITREIDYERNFHYSKNINLKNTKFIELRMFNDYQTSAYFNQKNELICQKETAHDKIEYTKWDTFGNKKDSLLSNKHSYMLGNKIIDFDQNAYSLWMENGDTSFQKIKVINKDFSFSREEEDQTISKIMKNEAFLYLYAYKKPYNEEEYLKYGEFDRRHIYKEENKYYRVVFEREGEVLMFFTRLDLYGKYQIEQQNAWGNEYPDAQRKEIVKKFFEEREGSQKVETSPIPYFFSAREMWSFNEWDGVIYYQIPLFTGDTFLAAKDMGYKSEHFIYEDSDEKILSAGKVSLYSNKNLHYQLLKVDTFMFLVRKKNPN